MGADPLTLPGVDVERRAPSVALPPEAYRQAGLGQWFTPPWLAAEVAAMAGVRGLVVLEPSAGSGRIVRACLDAGARRVIAYEIDPRWAAELRRTFAGEPVDVHEGDFLRAPLDGPAREAERIVGNPPYDHGCDTAHLERYADLLERTRGASATMLLRTVALHSAERWDGQGGEVGRGVWSRVGLVELAPTVHRVPFGEEAGKIDVSIFRFVRRDESAGAVRWITGRGQ